uniref:THIF-type NAD/FAD binding fold domain-containing protein n=1 Tax=Aegilops tauschii subsp. strangulata TaxID=200361 RepID=A0A453KE98_AEGTS
MTELNDGKPRKVKNARPYSFFLEEDTSSFGAYVRGGIVTQDVQRVIEYAISINGTLGDRKLEEIDKKLLHHFASGSRAVLNPMAAMFGGIVGQEVVKACSGKFHPLYQFFYFDSVESLPVDPLEPGDLKPKNSRYDAQISVFGSKLQNKLEAAKIFMVGSGALGCEFLKNLALMGISCSQNGNLTVTDDDVIEKSNLSRQFLFRDWNIGQPKSTVAATAAMKPLLESGTLGA